MIVAQTIYSLLHGRKMKRKGELRKADRFVYPLPWQLIEYREIHIPIWLLKIESIFFRA
jgi:hypothetical protein